MTLERHTYHLVQTWRIHYMQTAHNYNRHANTSTWQTVEGHKSPYYVMDQQSKVSIINLITSIDWAANMVIVLNSVEKLYQGNCVKDLHFSCLSTARVRQIGMIIVWR